MTAPRTDMHRLQELIRLHRMGVGSRERCRLLGMSPKTELKYRNLFANAGLLDGPETTLPDLEALRRCVEASAEPRPPRRYTSSVDAWFDDIERLVGEDAGAKAIHDWLKRTDDSYDGNYASVLRMVQRLKKDRGVAAEDVAIAVATEPGEVAQVDFGYVGRLFDTGTGRVRKAWVFVMVLGFSRHMFAKVVFDQKARTWQQLHCDAFRWFGGVPRVIVPDNLKAAVIRGSFGAGDREHLELSRSYRELARYYGFKVDPTPTYSPQKKGKVESAVSYVKHNAMATILSTDIDEVNAELADWVRQTAGLRHHGSTGEQPLPLFESEERGMLLPLPQQPFTPVTWKHATVHRDSHIEFTRKLYSVPWPLIGRKVWVRATHHSVEIYADDTRVATHERLYGRRRRSTLTSHLPEGRVDLMHRSQVYWEDRAQLLGPDVAAFIQDVFDSDEVLHKLRDVQAIVTHLEKFPPHRVQGAVRRAQFFGLYKYSGIRRILQDALDLEPLPALVVPQHGALTQPRFARNVEELLAKHLEEAPYESH